MYNNLSGHAARAINDEIRRSSERPERLMAEEAALMRRSRRRRWRTR
jgi:hypothetical protein